MKNSSKPVLNSTKLILERGEQQIDLGEVDLSASRVKFNKNFTMVWADKWTATGCTMLDLIMWLLANMNKGWILRVTDEKIAEALGCTRKTISKAKQTLHDKGILKYEAKAIFLNPEIFFRGGSPQMKRDLEKDYKEYKGIGDEKIE